MPMAPPTLAAPGVGVFMYWMRPPTDPYEMSPSCLGNGSNSLTTLLSARVRARYSPSEAREKFVWSFPPGPTEVTLLSAKTTRYPPAATDVPAGNVHLAGLLLLSVRCQLVRSAADAPGL